MHARLSLFWFFPIKICFFFVGFQDWKVWLVSQHKGGSFFTNLLHFVLYWIINGSLRERLFDFGVLRFLIFLRFLKFVEAPEASISSTSTWWRREGEIDGEAVGGGGRGWYLAFEDDMEGGEREGRDGAGRGWLEREGSMEKMMRCNDFWHGGWCGCTCRMHGWI